MNAPLIQRIHQSNDEDNAAYGSPVPWKRGLAFVVSFSDFIEQELWTTDGTESGTVLLDGSRRYLIGIQAAVRPRFVAFALGDRLVALSTNGELLAFDHPGIEPAVLLSDTAGCWSHATAWYGGAIKVLDKVFLLKAPDAGQEGMLWESDGTQGGTRVRATFPTFAEYSCPKGGCLAQAGSYLVFSVRTPQDRGRLYSFDPVTGELFVVRDGGGGDPCAGVTVGDRIFLPGSGGELFVVDGTLGEMRLVVDLPAGPEFTPMNPWALFPYSDSVVFVQGESVWISDGTQPGTRSLVTLSRDSIVGLSRGSFAVVGSSLFFYSGNSVPAEHGLWQSDGTPEGASRILPIDIETPCHSGAWAEQGGCDLAPLRPLADRLFFLAGQAWVSDGTMAGTMPLGQLVGQPEAWDAGIPIELAARLYLGAWDPAHGRELWTTDGTAAGTRMVADIRVGISSSDPVIYQAYGDHLLFFADDGVHGRGLWALDTSALGEGVAFLRGDCNADGAVTGTVSDAVAVLGYSFLGTEAPPCLAACDANGDRSIDISDAVYVLAHNFGGGPAPPAPYPECGEFPPRAGDERLSCGVVSETCH